MTLFFEPGAGDRGRTGDTELGKLVLYQLSYARELLTNSPEKLTQPCAESRL